MYYILQIIEYLCTFIKNFNMKRQYKSKNVDSSKYELINKDTGEIVQLKRGETLMISTDTKKMKAESKSYFTIDSDRLNTLVANGIKEVDLGLLLILASNIEFSTNRCMDENNTPFTIRALSQLLNQSEHTVGRKLKRLISLNLVARTKHSKALKRSYFYVNPYLMRRGKDLADFLQQEFQDIEPADNKKSKEIEQLNAELNTPPQ